jgi:kynurenine formamidase
MADWQKVSKKISNWGRWGPEDQLGTLNFITPERVAKAAALARTGKTFSLSIPLDGDGPQGAHGVRRNPIHLMSLDGSDSDIHERLGSWGGSAQGEITTFWGMGPMRFNDDYIIMPTQASTQWDALSHVYYDDQLYNGYPASAVTSLGASRDAIDPIASAAGIVGRGVLLDVARHRGLDRLAASTVIMPDELDEVAATQGVSLQEGDVVIVRTGWRTAFVEGMGGDEWLGTSPGLSWQCAEWLWEHSAAAVASDNIAVEVFPPDSGVVLLFHMLALRDMGLMLGEIWDLEALGQDCADDGVYEFLLSAPPLKIMGGVGSPINPIAIK